jgi:hypothetical protein
MNGRVAAVKGHFRSASGQSLRADLIGLDALRRGGMAAVAGWPAGKDHYPNCVIYCARFAFVASRSVV